MEVFYLVETSHNTEKKETQILNLDPKYNNLYSSFTKTFMKYTTIVSIDEFWHRTVR